MIIDTSYISVGFYSLKRFLHVSLANIKRFCLIHIDSPFTGYLYHKARRCQLFDPAPLQHRQPYCCGWLRLYVPHQSVLSRWWFPEFDFAYPNNATAAAFDCRGLWRFAVLAFNSSEWFLSLLMAWDHHRTVLSLNLLSGLRSISIFVLNLIINLHHWDNPYACSGIINSEHLGDRRFFSRKNTECAVRVWL